MEQIEASSKKLRDVASLYSISSLKNIEEKIDQVTSTFMQILTTKCSDKAPVDMGKWLQYYAFDSVGSLTFGKPFGFLSEDRDIADIISITHGYARYGAVVGVFSEWHPFIFRLLNALAPSGNVGLAYIIQFTANAIKDWDARSNAEKLHEAQRSESGTTLHSDFLATWLAKNSRDPEKFPIGDVYYHALPHVAAGGETTGISAAAVIYLLIKNPDVHDRLRKELEAAATSQKQRQQRLWSMKEAQETPYLQAVIKESLRIFPATGLIFPRVVPEGGLEMAGKYFPPG
ncbi:MAG: hypothetical protein Q9219_007459, partial [cf. Caloplaca sp. 3 TL-2023]